MLPVALPNPASQMLVGWGLAAPAVAMDGIRGLRVAGWVATAASGIACSRAIHAMAGASPVAWGLAAVGVALAGAQSRGWRHPALLATCWLVECAMATLGAA